MIRNEIKDEQIFEKLVNNTKRKSNHGFPKNDYSNSKPLKAEYRWKY